MDNAIYNKHTQTTHKTVPKNSKNIKQAQQINHKTCKKNPSYKISGKQVIIFKHNFVYGGYTLPPNQKLESAEDELCFTIL